MEDICFIRENSPDFYRSEHFSYHVDKTHPKYINNWVVSPKFACVSHTSHKLFASCFFFGFGCGIIFFPVPDKYGRKGTMNYVMPVFTLLCMLTIYGSSMFVKGTGYFL